jgi:hypothetical protein
MVAKSTRGDVSASPPFSIFRRHKMTDDQEFKALLAKFDKRMERFFRCAKRGQRRLDDISDESRKRLAQSEKEAG